MFSLPYFFFCTGLAFYRSPACLFLQDNSTPVFVTVKELQQESWEAQRRPSSMRRSAPVAWHSFCAALLAPMCRGSTAFTFSLVQHCLSDWKLNNQPRIPTKWLNTYILVLILTSLPPVLGIFHVMKILGIHLFISNASIFSEYQKQCFAGMDAKTRDQP